jgi:hypothetical protein
MESVFIGRGFTAGERARMAVVLFPMYGMTGMGLGHASDWAVEAFGVEDPEAYIAMKYGVLDWLISEFSPVETGVATRLAPVTAFTDLYSKIIGGEASFLEVTGGPSGQIISGTFGKFWDVLGSLYGAQTVPLTQDALELMRQPSGIDNVAKGWGILNNGIYRSKTGATIPSELKPSDAIISFLGFSPLEVTEYYDRKRKSYWSAKQKKVLQKEVQRDFDHALDRWSEDPDWSEAMIEAISTKIALSNLSEFEKARIREQLIRGRGNELFRIQKDLYQRDKGFVSNITGEILGD